MIMMIQYGKCGLIALLGLCSLTMSRAQTDSTTAPPRQQLLSRLARLQQQGCMFGHQDDPFYGLTWHWDQGRSDTKETCGDYPAVMGFELGGIEMGQECNLDGVPFARMRQELRAHVQRGGIVTVSWHPRNPLTGGSAWDVTDTTVVESVLPGGARHRQFLVWMRRVATFLQSLSPDEHHKIPIIFRPWHENNGSWFWWGERLCTPRQYRALWCMLQDELLVDGLDNLVWSYSPNMDPRLTEQNYLERYPGDDRVDLLGLDAYQQDGGPGYIRDLDQNLQMLTAYAQAHKKLLALTECGYKCLADAKWWTRVLLPQLGKYPLCYALTWRNANYGEFFGPSPGEKNAADFRAFYKAKNTLFLNDISNQ
jgi:hypothetical protein